MDQARPRAEAVAVLGERIVAAGTAAAIKRWIGPRTRVINLRGRFALLSHDLLSIAPEKIRDASVVMTVVVGRVVYQSRAHGR